VKDSKSSKEKTSVAANAANVPTGSFLGCHSGDLSVKPSWCLADTERCAKSVLKLLQDRRASREVLHCKTASELEKVERLVMITSGTQLRTLSRIAAGRMTMSLSPHSLT